MPGMSLGIMSATQGPYSTGQLLLDITQGARVASSAYDRSSPARLSLRPQGQGASVLGWTAARRRAESVPELLIPGLLASRIPGGAGYAGISGAGATDAVAAASRTGAVAAVSVGSAGTLLARVEATRRGSGLAVADLPGGVEGLAELRVLVAEREPGELVIVLQRAGSASGAELLWCGLAGLPGGGGKELSSQTTNQRGLVSATDLAPTILGHLDALPLPAAMTGRPIQTDGPLRAGELRSLMIRLRVIPERRLPALAVLIGAWALLLLVSAPWPRWRSWALRSGGVGMLWAPVVALIPAAIEPTAAVEYAIVALGCLALGAMTDRVLRWPRAAIAPATAAVALITVDALAGSQLLMRSLLGPDPIGGARFYGIGNELKSGLAVLVLAALAGALYPARRSRRAAAVVAAAGVLLAVVEGAARIGAGVGGVVLVSAGFALASVMLLPGAITRRRAVLGLLCPLAGVAALAALDLASAHGGGHFTGSILHARSAGAVRDVLVRRYEAAGRELASVPMAIATALVVLGGALVVRRRDRVLAVVGGDRGFEAALAGGLAAGLVGALVEDSGPVLLVVAAFTLACVGAYLWGRPVRAPARVIPDGSRDTHRAARSRARRPRSAPSG